MIEALVNWDMTLRINHKDFTKYLSFCLHLFKNLPEIFRNALTEIKQKMVSSIIPDKLVFNGQKYRTTHIYEALNLIFLNVNGLGELQKEKVAISDNLSC